MEFQEPTGPITQVDHDVLAAWADRRIDISEDAVIEAAPRAVLVIHDHAFGSRPSTVEEYRLRLQLLAELRGGAPRRRSSRRRDV